MPNKLLTPAEASESFKKDIDELLSECKTDDERHAVLDAVSRMLGGPGVEPPAHQEPDGL